MTGSIPSMGTLRSQPQPTSRKPAIATRRSNRGPKVGLRRVASLALDVAADGPPSEFRIFKAGLTTSTNGDFIFDEAAAESVMSHIAEHDVDIMIDLEHLSLDQDSPSFNPDALGYCRLEVRDGELWAVNVTWNVHGERRLTEKTQRYVSPAFAYDEDRRVTRILNIALTAMPATHGAMELVAARAAGTETSGPTQKPSASAMTAPATPHARNISMLTEEQRKKAMEVVKEGDGEGALALIEAQLVGGEGEGDPEGSEAMADDEDEDKAAAMMDGEDEDKPAAMADDSADDDEPSAAEARMAMEITGLKTPGDAWAELKRRNQLAVDLQKREAKLARDRRAFEAAERDDLVAQMVKLRKEEPGTAWADPALADERDKRKPAEPWASMPLEQLRARVERLGGQPPVTGGEAPRPPAKPNDKPHRLSREDKAAMDIRMGLTARKRATVREGSLTRFGVLQPANAEGGSQ